MGVTRIEVPANRRRGAMCRRRLARAEGHVVEDVLVLVGWGTSVLRRTIDLEP
jgi:hypothetical protein